MKGKRQWGNIYNMQKKISRAKFLHTEKLPKTSIKKTQTKRKLNTKKILIQGEIQRGYKFNPRGKVKLTEVTRQIEGTK